LLVIGDGRPAEYQRLARRLGIGAVVRFVGQVDDRRLEQLYRRCDVLVHPTFFDPCSLVVFEALASGCPVITTSRNGAAELMVSGRHGYVLENPGNVDALADALLRTADPVELGRMRTAVKALRPRLAFDSHARRVLEWLCSVS